MNYWLDLFTGRTWDEFRAYGAKVTGFRPHHRKYVESVEPGDILLCYLTGVMRWVGALEVLGPSDDETRIWKDAEFPVRLEVRPLIVLDAEYGVPMDQLEGQVDFYGGPQHAGKFKGFVRRSLRRFKHHEDGEVILNLLREAEGNPVAREVDQSKLYGKRLYQASRKKGRGTVSAVVSVPEPEEPEHEAALFDKDRAETKAATSRHTEIQYQLLKLGADMGFDLWVARNDRGRSWDGQAFSDIAQVVDELPTQFNEATNKTIELIDVLWLKGNSILAAFEVECTTSVYSGLLRMSDLLALQPNLNIRLFLVAPDDRRGKVEQEILRPTFMLREKPLCEICGFLAFSKLTEKIEGLRKLGVVGSMKPDFLEQTAEYFTEAEGFS